MSPYVISYDIVNLIGDASFNYLTVEKIISLRSLTSRLHEGEASATFLPLVNATGRCHGRGAVKGPRLSASAIGIFKRGDSYFIYLTEHSSAVTLRHHSSFSVKVRGRY